MSLNDIDVTVHMRVPLLFRDGAGTVRRAAFALKRGPDCVIRRVPPEGMARFPPGCPKVLEPYRIHAGRTWLAIPAAAGGLRAWDDLTKHGPARISRVVDVLAGAPKTCGIAVFGRSPLSLRRGFGQLEWPKDAERAELFQDEPLTGLAGARVAAMFRDGVVHDGNAVWVSTPPPVFFAASRHVRNVPPAIAHVPELDPLRGPAIRLDLRDAYLEVATRHCPVTRIEALGKMAAAVEEHLDGAGIPLGDADLGEFLHDLPCVALEWAETAIARRPRRRVREALRPGIARVMPLAALGASGLLDAAGEAEALEAGLDLLRATTAEAPNLLGWRHIAFVRDYAEEIARPRVAARGRVPEADASSLVSLLP